VPDTVAAGTVKALEAALQIPEGWLLSPDTPPLPDPVVTNCRASACVLDGLVSLPVRIPVARCEQIGPQAAQLRKARGLSTAAVARDCGVASATLSQWERAAFPKALTGKQLLA
jgi:hypothetical protein